ncbi:MAG: hypothetical protein ACREKS_09755 [Candidatus Rokuibacteriota bacterium]
MIKTGARKPLRSGGARVIPLEPERFLKAASKRFVNERPDRCPKCGSTFMCHEPAFVHCRYCGTLARVANASLVEQELFEIRSGLRVAC